MSIYVEVPPEIASVLQDRWGDLSVHVRESIALEGYREGLLGIHQVRQLLGLPTRMDAQRFLAEHGVGLFDLSAEDLEQDAQANRYFQQQAVPRT
ncbi:MAG: UPF0175 family protein [Bryobacter sp.]|nr:UPF0175 family protein [Bryobacter sp.]